MDSSIELQSSVLPQSDRKGKKKGALNNKKVVSKLALRKYHKKSVSTENIANIIHKGNKLCSSSDITSSSSSSYSSTSSNNVIDQHKINCTIIIDETDDECNNQNEQLQTHISPQKKDLVEKWLNSDKIELSAMFGNISTIHGDQIKTTNTVANSTLISIKKGSKTDKLEVESKKKILNDIDSSIAKDENVIIGKNSFNETDNTSINKSKFDENNLNASCEDLLNELYGNKWKTQNVNNIKMLTKTEQKSHATLKNNIKLMTATEPKKQVKPLLKVETTEKKKRVSITYKNPYLDSEREKSKTLLNTLQKERIYARIQEKQRHKCYESDESDSEKENINKCNLPARRLFLNSTDDEDSESSDCEGKKKLFNENKRKTEKKKSEAIEDDTKASDKNSNFLASLSHNVNTNSLGALYRKTYKTAKNELARKLFNMYNETIFDCKIPKDTNIEWNDRMTGTAGFCYCRKITRSLGTVERSVRIVLSNKILDSPDRLRDTLIHEMCHAAAWIVNEVADGHGHYWKSWSTKAMRIFPLLPPIKRCHDYVINTKYTYKCINCGYSIGRHSKSLDVEKKRCGLCYGKFEVYLNKTTKNGNVQMLATPKKGINKFAQFVKENYGLVKTPDRKHKDVMNILSKKFATITVT